MRVALELPTPRESIKALETKLMWAKLLKRWSGSRESNPRRPAWEIGPKLKILKIQNLVSTVLIADSPKRLILRGLIRTSG